MGTSRATSAADLKQRAAGLVALLLLAVPAGVEAQTDFGGDVRLFAFRILEETDLAGDGEPAEEDGMAAGDGGVELGILRLKLDSRWNSGDRDRFRFELHGTAQAASPPGSGAVTSVATGDTRRFFDLTKDSFGGGDVAGTTEIDRFNLRWDRPGFRMVAGRQAITWGVNYFWPVLDLFAPFAPQRIDRDYKPGVDALRFTVPVDDFSEVEIIAAGQGARTPDDLSLASMGRFHADLGEGASTVDFGYMVGGFHRDFVLGGFFSADVRGTGLRGEVSWTSPGCDPESAHPVWHPTARGRALGLRRLRRGDAPQGFGCGDFWRLTVGVDRLLTPRLTLIGEVSWNGFGAGDPADYTRLAEADRVRRGEVVSLGRRYAGLSLAWQAHPLLTVTAAVLANRDDGSALFQPGVAWSVSDSVTWTAGLIASTGRGVRDGVLGSEYGAVPVVAWSSLTAYF
jgi:hypothetical protein